MERELSKQKVDEFFRDLATKHVEINDYCGTLVEDLLSKTESVAGMTSPVLVFYGYQGRLSGEQQRTFNHRTISFSIVYQVAPDNFDAIYEAEDNAERIGLEVLSRINVMSKMASVGWLYNNFDKNSVHYSEIERQGVQGFYGVDFHFDLKNSEPMVVTPDRWTDGDQFCTG